MCGRVERSGVIELMTNITYIFFSNMGLSEAIPLMSPVSILDLSPFLSSHNQQKIYIQCTNIDTVDC